MIVTPIENVGAAPTLADSTLSPDVAGWSETASTSKQILLDETNSPGGTGSTIGFIQTCPPDGACTSRFAYQAVLFDNTPPAELEVELTFFAGVGYGSFAEEGPPVPDGASVEILTTGPDHSTSPSLDSIGTWDLELSQGGPNYDVVVTYPSAARDGVIRFSHAAGTQSTTPTRGLLYLADAAEDGQPLWAGKGVSDIPLALGSCDSGACHLEAQLRPPTVGEGTLTLIADAREGLDPLAPPIVGVEVSVSEAPD